MIIKFIKTSKYITQLSSDGDTFIYLCGVSNQSIDPDPIIQNGVCINDQCDRIFYSGLGRVKKSLKNYDTRCILSEELKEVLFDLDKLCTYEEWKMKGSVIVRRRFKEFFIADKLPQKRSDIFKSIKLFLFNQCGGCDNVIAISHSFKMKLFEAYLKTNGQIEKRPELINKFIRDNEKTYDFGEGFSYKIKTK